MIINKKEVASLARILEQGQRDLEELGTTVGRVSHMSGPDLRVLDYLRSRPHLLVASLFDEYVAFGSKTRRPRPFDWSVPGVWDRFSPEDQAFFRNPGGDWLWLYHADSHIEGRIMFHSYTTWREELLEERRVEPTLKPHDFLLWKLAQDPDRGAARYVPHSQLLSMLTDVASRPPENAKYLISPGVWTPEAQEQTSIRLQECTGTILRALVHEKVQLRDLHWKVLEDVVAEILRSQGMEVYSVRTSPQGGRDIIARGELIPGLDPLTIAVEVKQRDVVGMADVSSALYQNRYFPALLLATAGRFSAGVLQERRSLSGHLRLLLKDGVALKDMLESYGLQRGWRAYGRHE